MPLITPFGLTSFLDPIDQSFNNIKAAPGGACIGHPVKHTFILQRSMVSRQTDHPRPSYPPSDASCVSTVTRTMPPLEHPVNSAHEDQSFQLHIDSCRPLDKFCLFPSFSSPSPPIFNADLSTRPSFFSSPT